MFIDVAVKEYLVEIEVRKFMPKTIRSYRNNLNLFVRYCKEEEEIEEIEDVTLPGFFCSRCFSFIIGIKCV